MLFARLQSCVLMQKLINGINLKINRWLLEDQIKIEVDPM